MVTWPLEFLGKRPEYLNDVWWPGCWMRGLLWSWWLPWGLRASFSQCHFDPKAFCREPGSVPCHQHFVQVVPCLPRSSCSWAARAAPLNPLLPARSSHVGIPSVPGVPARGTAGPQLGHRETCSAGWERCRYLQPQSCHWGLRTGPRHSENSFWQTCPKHFVPSYWAVTPAKSPHTPFSCKLFTLTPSFFFFLLLFSCFLQKTWFFDSLAVYSSICVPSALHPVGLDASLPVSAAEEI